MLVGVMLAEEKLSSGWQLGTDASCSAAAIAPVGPGQLGSGQSCGVIAPPFWRVFNFLRRSGFWRCSRIVIQCVVSHEFRSLIRQTICDA